MFLVNGEWAAYGQFGACTVACGGGTKTRSRVCNNPAPAHGGSDCAGSADDTVACNSAPCPGKNIQLSQF